jgi:hypothetical protein
MALKNMSLLTGATVSATGGTALAFTDNGVSVANGVQLVCTTDTDFQTRRICTVKYRPATVDSKLGTYGKDKKSISLALPVVLTTGQVVFCTWRIEREVHPSVAAATVTDMNKLGAQLLIDTDTDGFWATGSLS